MSQTSVGCLQVHIPVGGHEELREMRKLTATKVANIAFSFEYLDAADIEVFNRTVATVLRNNHNVTTLSLRDCGLGNENIRVLMEAIAANTQSNLVVLDLADNYLTDKGADAIITLLMVNRKIESVCLDGNIHISENKLSFIQELLKRNQTNLPEPRKLATAKMGEAMVA